MAQKIAILEYSFIFNPSETWPTGYEFENSLGQYFREHGIDAQIVETAGGTGRRVIFMSKVALPKISPQQPNTKAREQIKQIAQKTPPKDYKKFQQVRHDTNTPPKPTYFQGRTNRKKVRIP